MNTPFYGIIPARYASSRFPGKALADIAGKPMFWHVYSRARQCRLLKSVTLATDDVRICSVSDELGLDCVMTNPDHPSGTDRVYEAARILQVEDNAVVINIQGDEPLLDPAMLEALAEPFADPAVEVCTLAMPIDAARAANPNQVKVVLNTAHDALYFSRALIPYVRDEGAQATHFGHIGLYAFRMRALARFVSLPPSSLELAERLEQLRFLENGIPIRVVLAEKEHSPGVDTPEDLARILPLFGKNASPGK